MPDIKHPKDATVGSSPAYTGRRSFHHDSWHFCARCGSRVLTKDLTWQRGLLVCKVYDCLDRGVNPSLGDREANIARVLQDPGKELQPDPKLTNPMDSTAGNNDDIIF